MLTRFPPVVVVPPTPPVAPPSNTPSIPQASSTDLTAAPDAAPTRCSKLSKRRSSSSIQCLRSSIRSFQRVSTKGPLGPFPNASSHLLFSGRASASLSPNIVDRRSSCWANWDAIDSSMMTTNSGPASSQARLFARSSRRVSCSSSRGLPRSDRRDAIPSTRL